MYELIAENQLYTVIVYSRQVPMKMEQTECSETSAYKIEKRGNYPKENIQHSEHRESLKSRILYRCV